MKKGTRILLQMLAATAPHHLFIHNLESLPVQIPMHYNAQFEVDRYGTKPELIGLLIVLYLITVATALLIVNLNKIDPKRSSYQMVANPVHCLSRYHGRSLYSLPSLQLLSSLRCHSDQMGANGFLPNSCWC